MNWEGSSVSCCAVTFKILYKSQLMMESAYGSLCVFCDGGIFQNLYKAVP